MLGREGCAGCNRKAGEERSFDGMDSTALDVCDGVPATRSLSSLVESVQRTHCLLVQLKVKHVCVLGNSRRSVGFGKGHCREG